MALCKIDVIISFLLAFALVIPHEVIAPLPINETSFSLPANLPSWPPGDGFAQGTIDLGGLQIYQVTSFQRVWSTQEGGPDNRGAIFFESLDTPEGFFFLGSYAQPINRPISGWALVGKDTTEDPKNPALKPAIDYNLVWSSESLEINQDGVAYIWYPIPPVGYTALGYVVTTSPQKPLLDKIRCVRTDFTDFYELENPIWDYNGVNVYSTRPKERGVKAMGIPTGTFHIEINGTGPNLGILKNKNGILIAMPNQNQIVEIVKTYSPFIYFHPEEEYFPSSLTWFFNNGALLYTKGNESNPVPIDPTGSNLPNGGGNDGSYWIDLPIDGTAKENVKKGDLNNTVSYLHVKPMFGGTFTDVAIWIFYPFNGPSKAKVLVFDISLGKIGEHVGDWEHVTLRISNFDGSLKSMYFSQHGKGVWMDASELEYENGNKPVAYSSLHGHASYPKEGLVVRGNKNFGIRDDTGKSSFYMDTGSKFLVVNADYLGSIFTEPPWLNFAREWGPKIDYDIADEITKVAESLPWPLRKLFEKNVKKLPPEIFSEEGPNGPKWKDNWLGDEKS